MPAAADEQWLAVGIHGFQHKTEMISNPGGTRVRPPECFLVGWQPKTGQSTAATDIPLTARNWPAASDGGINRHCRPHPQGVVTGIVGQKLGQFYRRTCYPGPARILAHAPVEAVGGSLLTTSQWQRHMQREQRHRIAADLVDHVRGASLSALNDCENGEDRLRHLVAALDRLFPGIQPVPYLADAEQAIDFNPKR